MRRGAVDQAERHARVRGVESDALALDPEQLSPARVPLDDEPLGRAGDEVGDDRVDGDPPAGDRDPGLAGRDEDRREPAARCASRSSSSETVIFPIAQSEPTVSTIVAGSSRFSPVGHVQTGGRLAQVAQLDAVLARELDQLRVVAQELVQAVLDVEPARDAALQELAPRRREAAARRGDADERRRRVEAERVVDGADDRDPLVGLPRPLRVEDRDDRVGAVANDAAHRLAVVRIAGLALSEDPGTACRTPSPGSSEGSWTPSTSSTPGHGSSAISRLPSRSTWSQRLAIARRRRCRGPTRSCSRASRRARARARRAPSAPPRGSRPTSRA